MRLNERPHHNGHVGMLVPHPMRPDLLRRAPEFVQQRLRIIFLDNEAEPMMRNIPWARYDSTPAIDQDDEPEILRPQQRACCQRLYPEPGQEIAAAWSDIRDFVVGQLAHPERLRDSHRLKCHAQVYEALAPQRIEMLAAAMLGDPSLASELHLLAPWLAARLGLVATLPKRPPPPPQPRQPGIAHAGDRLLRLIVAGDPTDDVETADLRDAPQPRSNVPRPTAPQPPASGARRTAIPQRFLQPWEFKRSRDEAIYEMHFAANPGWWQRLTRVFRGSVKRREFIRWQIMLSGKEVDDQLWGVRPPDGGLRHPKVRDWAACNLALAGCDPGLMLDEWEIFWRRKAD